MKSSTIEPAHVAQAQLAADFVGGFEVDFEDGRFLVLAAFVAAGVDVDGDERLGFVDDDVAAALEMDLAGEGVLDLPRDVEAVEDRLVLGVELDLVGGALGDLGDHRRACGRTACGLSTTMRSTSSVRKSRTVRSMRSGSWKTQVADGCCLDAFLDAVPFLEQQREVADEVARLLAFADGAHDDAHAFGNGESRGGSSSSAGVPPGSRSCGRCRFGRSSAAARGSGRAERGWS